MKYVPISPQNRQQINDFISQHWFTTEMVILGEIVDMTTVEGVAAMDGEGIAGLITYRVSGEVCEITSLDSLREGLGIGTDLLEKVIAIAREMGCHKITLVTTNDNIHAIRFYQKQGFDLVRLHHYSIKQARGLKPEIPLFGQNGIPIEHELEFEFLLENG
ncbi:MAG TPA: GNAT family N-acetyltransferase [Anaerolineaceae bacterium]|nr:GNAT family N-acetyltransferase [Anaerolineaceae bacterium]